MKIRIKFNSKAHKLVYTFAQNDCQCTSFNYCVIFAHVVHDTHKRTRIRFIIGARKELFSASERDRSRAFVTPSTLLDSLRFFASTYAEIAPIQISDEGCHDQTLCLSKSLVSSHTNRFFWKIGKEKVCHSFLCKKMFFYKQEFLYTRPEFVRNSAAIICRSCKRVK